jgi:2-oxoglutarate dehydrogenase E2 component (dihydrolipoamide succinyltransferase)
MEVQVPSPGESISEVDIASWLVADGDYVEKDQTIAEIDSDKATLELTAEEAGVISIKVGEGETVAVGDTVAEIDTEAEKPEGAGKEEESASAKDDGKEKAEKEEKAPAKEEKKEEKAPAASAKKEEAAESSGGDGHAKGHPSPAAKKMMEENGVSADEVEGTGKGGRILKQDIQKYLASGIEADDSMEQWGGSREYQREKMSSLRRKVSERLVSVKNETAMLTTFNEVDMSYVMELRQKYKETFKEHHDVSLGFMSFFTKAVTEALHNFPDVNSMIDGNEIVRHDYADVGIAVSSPKGLMVPILRNAEQMDLATIEKEIKRLATKARDGKITIEEMTGGTFTITNGGVFGSMLSTPIINPPQSAILGMHNIVERPVAVDGKVEVRPVMYVALSYDHRIIDGKDSVGFLYQVKEMIESPERLLFNGKDPVEVLLGL